MSDCYSKIYNKCGLELLSENIEDNSLNLALIDPPYIISKKSKSDNKNRDHCLTFCYPLKKIIHVL